MKKAHLWWCWCWCWSGDVGTLRNMVSVAWFTSAVWAAFSCIDDTVVVSHKPPIFEIHWVPYLSPGHGIEMLRTVFVFPIWKAPPRLTLFTKLKNSQICSTDILTVRISEWLCICIATVAAHHNDVHPSQSSRVCAVLIPCDIVTFLKKDILTLRHMIIVVRVT